MGCPPWASRIALLLLVAAAFCTVHATASGDHPFNMGRHLMQTQCHVGTTDCEGASCVLCPYNQCKRIPVTNNGKPTCTNIFFGATVPVLPIRNVSVNIDGNLCTGWADSNAIYLAPMYTGVSHTVDCVCRASCSSAFGIRVQGYTHHKPKACIFCSCLLT